MVPTELLATAMAGGFAIALTAVLAMAGVLGSRISDLRSDVSSRFTALDGRMGAVQDELVTVRAALGAIDARLTTLER